MMRFGVITFPGSNCDQDCLTVVHDVLKQPVESIWHDSESLNRCDVVILPGGFSYGDYLRTGAIARFSRIMESLRRFADEKKGTILGICNGFQILCEAGLLPGALIRNQSMQFICEDVTLRVETRKTSLTRACPRGALLRIPIAHGEGNYTADPHTLRALEKNDQILFRYSDISGHVTPASNPNGSFQSIAGVCNQNRNVFGLMPHPERASENLVGCEDGRLLFRSLLQGATN